MAKILKLKIKTLNQKTLMIDIEETKTVHELKKELSLYPDIGVKPELQKVIYAGKILENDDKLSVYNIDEKRFMVVMILKQPQLEPPKAGTSKRAKDEESSKQEQKEEKKIKATDDKKSPTTPSSESEPSDSRKEALVRQIVGMGYPMPEVRKALAASFYNPERAIEYLVEGIPNTSSAPEADTVSDTDTDLSMTAFEVFRGDPLFQRIRNALQRHPELLDVAILRIGRSNPHLLNLINENQSDFLNTLIQGSAEEADSDNDDDEDMDG